MRVHVSLRRSRLNFICLFLTYTLNISLFAPFAIKPAQAMLSGKTKSVPATIKGTIPATTKAQETMSRWRDRELLVRFREHAPISKINALLRAQGAQWNGQLRGQSRIERLRLSVGADPEAVAATLRASELVDFAESNYLITADQTASQATTNDPRLSEQWALQNTVSSQAWRLTTGSKQTVIAVVDSGIDFSHPDLIHNQWDNTLEQANTRDNDGNGFNSDLHGWDFITNSSGIVDEQGHGTAIAGIIAAQGNNSLGITGVMWQASLMSLRVLDKTGTGDIAAAVEAIDYATAHGAQVINCSWGTDDSSQALREAINRAAQLGVVVITSAGNSSRDIETTAHYPASYDLPNVIAVAATDKADVLTPSSNWGAMHVSIAAPGAEILTTKMGGKYQTVSGTSASAPFVAGVAGLIKSLRPWLNVERTREIILRGARQVPSLSDKVTSKGVVSAAGAAEVLNTLPPNEGTEENGDINGGERGNNGNNGNGRSNLINTRSDSGNRDGSEFRVTPPARTQGAPGMGLPNLDELRGKQPTNPKAADPIPSTRCSHKDPECAPRKSRAAIELPTSLLAWGFGFPFKPSYSEDTSGPVSDSPFRLFWSTFTSSSVLLPLPQTTRTNVALATNGGVASASSTYSDTGYSYTPGAAINDERKGLPFSSNLWHDAAPGNSFPDWLQVDFNGTKIIDEVDVYTLQDNYTSATEPTESMTFSLYGLTGYEVQYWNGSGWVTVPGGSVTGNNKVWKKVTFSPLTTTRIRVLTNASGDGYSRITEV
jgi:subtilisin family serine protease